MPKDLRHEGKRLFWSGDWVSLCGRRWPPEAAEHCGWFSSVNCPDCKKARNQGKRL